MRRRLRAVVGGYMPGEGGRARTFGSVLVGLYEPSGLRWIAAVGSGFDDSALEAFHDALLQLERSESPFTYTPTLAGACTSSANSKVVTSNPSCMSVTATPSR